MDLSLTRRYLPWIVATALFMEQLDSTIVNTGIPAMSASLGVTPLSLRAVATSYMLALAVSIPVSGWLAERFGSRRVFLFALGLFTASSILCGAAPNAGVLIASRVPQGVAAAMMMPVGRSAIIQTFPKSDLLRVMNFIIIPALIGPLLGPTVGGLIVHWLSWRDIFFVNVPVGLVALWLGFRMMPDYRNPTPQALDVVGFVLFASGAALLSWLLEVFGEHSLPAVQIGVLLVVAVTLLLAYGWHATQVPFPLLRLALFKVRTFRVSTLGGFVTRLGIAAIVAVSLLQGLFNSLQFSGINTMAYADVEPGDAPMASTLASTLQQMALGFGLAIASMVTVFFLSGLPQSNQVAVTAALRHGFLALAAITLVSSLSFWRLRSDDGESVSRGAAAT